MLMLADSGCNDCPLLAEGPAGSVPALAYKQERKQSGSGPISCAASAHVRLQYRHLHLPIL